VEFLARTYSVNVLLFHMDQIVGLPVWTVKHLLSAVHCSPDRSMTIHGSEMKNMIQMWYTEWHKRGKLL